MNILKQAGLPILALLPSCLIGMDNGSWMAQNKKGQNVLIEWCKISKTKDFLDIQELLAPVVAEVFTDEMRDGLLDKYLQIKKKRSPNSNLCSENDIKKADANINDAKSDRKMRVKKFKQTYIKAIEKQRNQLVQGCIDCNNFVVTVKDGADEVLGFAIFKICPENNVSLELIGVIPCAQGKGLSRLLTFSILKLALETKNIELNTKIGNTKAQAVYKALDFEVISQSDSTVSFRYVVKSTTYPRPAANKPNPLLVLFW